MSRNFGSTRLHLTTTQLRLIVYTWWKCPFHGTSAGKRCLKMIESYKPSYWQQKCMSISWQWKNISHTKPIQLVCEVGRKTYVSLSQFPLFHILKLMDKIISIFGSYRFLRRPLTALQKICHKENCEQRTMHALSEEFDPIELRRGRASSETTDLRTLEFGPD